MSQKQEPGVRGQGSGTKIGVGVGIGIGVDEMNRRGI